TSYPGNYEDYLRKKEELAGRANSNQDASPVAPQTHVSEARRGAPRLFPAEDLSQSPSSSSNGQTIVIEGGVDGPAASNKTRRLNPIKQKQMEDRCAFLEEEIPRVEASIAHTEEQ